MQYQSTRDKNLKASSAQAILNGLAPRRRPLHDAVV